jgi:hypothetical protein
MPYLSQHKERAMTESLIKPEALDDSADLLIERRNFKEPLHGPRYGDFRGQWPGDKDDGFEKWVREMRDKEVVREPPPWW